MYRLFHLSLYLLVSLSCVHRSSALKSWPDYDKCANATLYQYVPEVCLFGNDTFTANAQGNACLCPNKAFMTSVARDLYKYCYCDVLERTAATFVEQCNATATPSAFNETEIVALGSNQTSGCVNPPPEPSGGCCSRPKTATILKPLFGTIGGVLGMLVLLQLIGTCIKKKRLTPSHWVQRVFCRQKGEGGKPVDQGPRVSSALGSPYGNQTVFSDGRRTVFSDRGSFHSVQPPLGPRPWYGSEERDVPGTGRTI